MTEERILLDELIKIFALDTYDFLGYRITKNNPLQYHHIIFRTNGGLTTLSNGAPLTKEAHSFFHTMVRKDYITAKKITREFIKLNESKTPPSFEYYNKIKSYINSYQEKISDPNYFKRKRVK